MKTERMHINDALEQGSRLPFAWVRTYSNVFLGQTPPSLRTEELLEARFFDETKEIRIFLRNGQLCAAALQGEPQDCVILKKYRVENSRFGSTITTCLVLDVDEDGQSFVSAVRLTGWEGARENV